MKRSNFQLLVEATILIAFLPALLGYYLNYKGKWIWSLICYLISVSILCVPIFIFVGIKSIQFFLPLILRTLNVLNKRLLPIAHYVSQHKILGPLIGIFIRSQFFMWFMILLMSDQVIRILVGRVAGLHATNNYLSMINVVDSRFFKTTEEGLAETTPKQKEQNSKLTNFEYGKSNPDFKRPQYSISMAHTLAVASKLIYEDVAVVKYELEKAGFDVEHTFKAIGYKNSCAYVVEKNNDVLLVFRGTNPLNIQNYVTNLDAGLTKVSSASRGYMGKVHKGFWDAMGATEISEQSSDTSLSDIRIDLSNASLSQSISSALIGVMKIVKALSLNIFTNVIDPIDASWAGHDIATVRHQSLFSQAENFILQLFGNSAVMEQGKNKRLFITGHSLGGALATVFVAKMIQKDSPLLNYFAGLYTYGQPNIGDKDFGKSFGSDITCKIFNHTYNNDVVPRIPYWYSPPPGTLVYIDSSYKISIYPPNQKTQDPIPVRGISYLHLSGLLNKSVIYRLRSETPVRILFRLLFPFFVNDHFPSDYCDALLKGDVEWVILGEEEGGTDEQQDFEEKKKSKRYSLKIGDEEEMY